MALPANIRDRFEMPEGIYLLSHSVGCLPRTTRVAVETQWLDVWAEKGSNGWGDWLGAVERFRGAVATLIGASAEDICPQTNLSSGLSKILPSLPARKGRNRIVLCEEDFPTVGFIAAAAERLGLETRFIPRGQAASDLNVWKEAFEHAQVALITQAFSNRSARLPVADITKLAREMEVFTVVDAVQATGVIPYTVDELEADFLLGTCVKFLCGGSGAGYLWASREAADQCRPVDTGWFSHENPFAFDIHDYRPAPGAMRFWGGTPSIAPYVSGACGIEEILRAGVENIHQHNQDLIDRLHGALPEGAIASERERDRRGNAVLIRVPDSQVALETLGTAGIAADSREGAIRVSPHLYNTEAEIDRLIAIIRPLTA